HLRLGRAEPQSRLVGKCSVLLPRIRGDTERLGQQVPSARGRKQCLASTNLGKAEVLKNGKHVAALLLDLAETLDELDHCASGVLLKRRSKIPTGHTGDLGKAHKVITARRHGVSH